MSAMAVAMLAWAGIALPKCDPFDSRFNSGMSRTTATRTATEVPALEPGAMVRTGKAAAARNDGMPDDISVHLRAAGSEICSDNQALDWCYNGGPLPQ